MSSSAAAISSSHVLKVRRPQAIVVDVIGTLTKTGFIEDILWRYVLDHVDTFLQRKWGNPVVMRDVDLLRDESHGSDGGSAISGADGADEAIQSSVSIYFKNCIKGRRFNEPIRVLLMHIILDGYAHGSLMTHVYTDVAVNMGKWSNEGIPIYVLSNGYKEVMRRFLAKTNHDNLDCLVKGYFDTSLGSLSEPDTYRKLQAKLRINESDILFLTHSGMEGVCAYQAGLSVILVATHREDVHRERTTETMRCGLPIIRTFKDLSFESDAPPASSMVDDDVANSFYTSQCGSSSYSGASKGTSTHGSSSVSGSKSSNAPSSASSSKGSSNVSSGASKGSSQASSSVSKDSSQTSSSALMGSSNVSSSASKGSSQTSSSASKGSSNASSQASKGSSTSRSGSNSSMSRSKSSSAANGSKASRSGASSVGNSNSKSSAASSSAASKKSK